MARPGRPRGSKNKRSAEFVERFDYLQNKYGFCPVEFLFMMASNSIPAEVDNDGNEIAIDVPLGVRRECARDLLPYRFPKRSQTEVKGTGDQPLQFVMKMGTDDNSTFELPAETAADSAA